MEIGGKSLEKIRVGEAWTWRWGDWSSSSHEYLEERPWTPRLVANQLCFAARDGDIWRVVWQDRVGAAYDDVYDIEEHEGLPLYSARSGDQFLVVLGDRESQRFPSPILKKICDGQLLLLRHPSEPGEPGVEPRWQPKPSQSPSGNHDDTDQADLEQWVEQLGDDLRFDIGRSEAGSFVRIVHLPTGTFVFQDPLGDEPTVAVRDRLLRRLRQKVRDFPEFLEPWEEFVTDDQRKAFQTELAVEISDQHPLHGRAFRALAHRSDCDDVLVELPDERVAVVHLTWTGTRESDPKYPQTRFFENVSSWIKLCMHADHSECQEASE